MSNQQQTARVLSVPEFCDRAGIAARTFYAILARGEGPATVKIGRRRGVLEATAEAWLKSREREG